MRIAGWTSPVRSGDGDELKEYWTQDPEGLAKWANTKDPWTTLHKRLLKYMKDPLAAAVTTSYYKAVFGRMPNQKGKGKRRAQSEGGNMGLSVENHATVFEYITGRSLSGMPVGPNEAAELRKWVEHQHPRGKGGKFAKKGSGGGGGTSGSDSEGGNFWDSVSEDDKDLINDRIGEVADTAMSDEEADMADSVLNKLASGEDLTQDERDFVEEQVGVVADNPDAIGGNDAKPGPAQVLTTLSADELNRLADRLDSVLDTAMSDEEADLAASVLTKINSGQDLTPQEQDFVDDQLNAMDEGDDYDEDDERSQFLLLALTRHALERAEEGNPISAREAAEMRARWNPADHPRGPDGKFVKKGSGGGGTPSSSAKPATPAKSDAPEAPPAAKKELSAAGKRKVANIQKKIDSLESYKANNAARIAADPAKAEMWQNLNTKADAEIAKLNKQKANAEASDPGVAPKTPPRAVKAEIQAKSKQLVDNTKAEVDSQINRPNQNADALFSALHKHNSALDTHGANNPDQKAANSAQQDRGLGIKMSQKQIQQMHLLLSDVAKDNAVSSDRRDRATKAAIALHNGNLSSEDVSFLNQELQDVLNANDPRFPASKFKGLASKFDRANRAGNRSLQDAERELRDILRGSNSRDHMRNLPVIRSAPTASVVEPDQGGEEYRGTIRAQYRSDVRTDGPVMRLEFSKFNNWYPINSTFEGKFLERVAPGAFVKTINERGGQAKVLFNHGKDPQIGEKILGPVGLLEERSDGTYSEVPLFDTSYNRDLLPALQSGAYGSSFMFHVMDDVWDYSPARSAHNPEGVPERTVTAVRLLEFGPVTWPANPAATAGMRSDTDRYFGELRAADPEQYNVFAEMFSEFRASNSLGLEDVEVRTSSDENDRDEKAKKVKKPIDSEDEAAEDTDEPEDVDDPEEGDDKDHPFGDDESKRSAQLRDLEMLEFS